MIKNGLLKGTVRRTRPIMPVVVILAVAAMRVHAATYHVAATGSDMTGTGSLGSPWATIQRAVNAANAGDTVLVGDGAYAGFHSVNAGTRSNPIVIRANGPAVVINSRNGNTIDNINIENTDYVTVEGFRSVNSLRCGIRVAVSRGVTVRNNVCGNPVYWGVFTAFAPDVTVDSNTCYGAAQQHGIYVSNSDTPDDNPVVRGNTCYNNYQNGIQLNGDLSSGGDGNIEGALIENNVVHDNGQKGLSLISISGGTVRNNLIYNNGTRGSGAGGIHLAQEPGTGVTCENNVIVNNTVVEPAIGCIRITDGRTNTVFNNLCAGSSGIVDEAGGNGIDGVSNIIRTGTAGLFVNAAAGDYRPPAGSAGIDAGAAAYAGKSAPVADISGNTRPSGSGFDAGAYEYRSAPGETYSVNGYIRNGSGEGLPGVAVSLTGSAAATVTTDSGGFYTFSGLSNGGYTVTPSRQGYTFTPANRIAASLAASITGWDFTGTNASFQPQPAVVSWGIRPGETKVVGSTKWKGIINPGSGDTAKIYFKGTGTGKFEVKIYTLTGELVWEDERNNVSEGIFEWLPGNAASGGYVVAVKGPGLSQTKKIAVLR